MLKSNCPKAPFYRLSQYRDKLYHKLKLDIGKEKELLFLLDIGVDVSVINKRKLMDTTKLKHH